MTGPAASPTISLCMIVKNEARWLARCLAGAARVVDEIVVVDTGSADGTQQIAANNGARVLEIAWPNSFADARNASLAQARCDWVLVLDADETLAPATAAGLRPLLAQAQAEGYSLVQRSWLPAGDLQSYDDLPIVRLFRNRPAYRYEGVIHEQVGASIVRQGGRLADSGLLILHDGYRQQAAQGGAPRSQRNLALLQEMARANPADAYVQYQLGATYKAVGQPAQAEASLETALRLGRNTLSGPVLTRLYMKLAQLNLAADRYGPAARHSRASLDQDPTNIVARYTLALASFYTGDLPEALRSFRIIRAAPNANLGDPAEIDAVIEYCTNALAERKG